MLKISQDFGALGAAPMAGAETPAAPQPSFQIIYSPLDSLGKILADLDFKSFLLNNFGDDPKTLALKIWTMYGGNEDDLLHGKPGKRNEVPESDDTTEQENIQKEEYNQTRNKRWERLPLGVSINDITNLESIENAIVGGFETLAKSYSKPAAASSMLKWIRIANIADEAGNYTYADKLLDIILNV